MALVADVLDADGLARAVERFAGQAGGLDALVCAAGRFRAIGPLAAVEPDSWWLDLETALRGVSQSIRALPQLQDSDAATIAVLIGPGHAGALPSAPPTPRARLDWPAWSSRWPRNWDRSAPASTPSTPGSCRLP